MIVVFEENVNYAASDKIRIVFKGQDGSHLNNLSEIVGEQDDLSPADKTLATQTIDL